MVKERQTIEDWCDSTVGRVLALNVPRFHHSNPYKSSSKLTKIKP